MVLLSAIDAEYTRHPFYGSRRMVVFLVKLQYPVNRKRIQRLMGILGLAGMAPGPNTSRPHPEHKIYPYLLRGVAVIRPNQVWSTDIPYVRLERVFVYLTAVIDWYSRKVLTWQVSNTLDSSFCVECLERALRRFGKPEIFNTDQGCQYTSDQFTGVLKAQGTMVPGIDMLITCYGRSQPSATEGGKITAAVLSALSRHDVALKTVWLWL